MIMNLNCNRFGRVTKWSIGEIDVLQPTSDGTAFSLGGILTRYPVSPDVPHDGLLVSYEEDVQGDPWAPRVEFEESLSEGIQTSTYQHDPTDRWPWAFHSSNSVLRRESGILIYQTLIKRSKACSNPSVMPSRRVINIHVATEEIKVTGPTFYVISCKLIEKTLRLSTVNIKDVVKKQYRAGSTIIQLATDEVLLKPGQETTAASVMLSLSP